MRKPYALLVLRLCVVLVAILTVGMGVASTGHGTRILISVVGGATLGLLGALIFKLMPAADPKLLQLLTNNVQEAQRILSSRGPSSRWNFGKTNQAPEFNPSNFDLLELQRSPPIILLCWAIAPIIWLTPSFTEAVFNGASLSTNAIPAFGAHFLAMLLVACGFSGILSRLFSWYSRRAP